MRKSETVSLRAMVEEYLKVYGLDYKLREVRLINSWPDIVGPAVASRTKKLYFRNKVLYVELTSSVVRHEMMMIRPDLIDAINQRAGEGLVTDIVFR